MSIGSVGASGASQASQMLAKMLSRLNDSGGDDDTSTSSTTSASCQTSDQAKTAGLKDSSKLSSQIIGLMVMMQAGGQPPSQGSDPVSQAFAAIDADGSGSISQDEMETYVQGIGGTEEQADTLFASLGGGEESGISQDAFAQAAEAGRPPRGPHGPPPSGGAHGGGGAEQVFDALDTNQDGTVSADELAVMFANNTNGSNGSDVFSSADGNGDGSVTKDEFSSFLKNVAERAQSDMSLLSSFRDLAARSYSASDTLLNVQASSTQSIAA